MKKTIFSIFICGAAWGIYWGLSNLQIFKLENLIEKSGYLWLTPSLKVLLIKILTAEVIIFPIWLLTGYTKKDHTKRLSALQEDAYTYLPALVLFIALGQFLSPSNRFFELPKFLVQDLGPFLPLLVIGTTLYLKFKKWIISTWNWFVSRIEQYSHSRISWFLFLGTLAIYIFFSLRLVPINAPKNERYYLLTGDEPHYLLITHSLVFDRDFNLYNNAKEGHSLIYYDRVVQGCSGGQWFFKKYARGSRFTAKSEYWHEKQYSIFRPGLPILLSPWYKLGIIWKNQVRLTVILFLNFLASLLVVNLFLLSHAVTKHKFGSLLVTIFVALSMPIIFYSTRIFTELPAAVLLIYSFRKIFEKGFDNFFKVLLIGLCISCLPWLHDKYLLLAGPLILFFLYQWKKQNGSFWILGTIFIPLLISISLLMRHYYLLFGVPYPVNMHPGVSLTNFTQGFFGLWLDEAHGLFAYTPIYIISIVGFVLIFREKSENLLWFVIIPFLYLLEISSFAQWWGGFCPPGRYLLPAIPFLVPLIAYSYQKLNSNSFKGITVILGIIGMAIGIGSMVVPGRLYKYMHPFIPYAEKINLRGLLPNLLEPSFEQYRLVVIWTLFIIIFVIFFTRKHLRINQWISGYLVIFLGLATLNLVRIKPPEEWTEKSRLIFYRALVQENVIAVLAEAKKTGHQLIKDKKSFITPPGVNYEAENLLAEKTNKVFDENASDKRAVFGKAGKVPPGYFIYGPYEKFPAGNYKACFRMKTSNNESQDTPLTQPSPPEERVSTREFPLPSGERVGVRGHEVIAILDVASGKGTVIHGKREVIASDFKEINKYQNITFTFKLADEVPDIEFRVYFTGKRDILVDKITLTPI